MHHNAPMTGGHAPAGGAFAPMGCGASARGERYRSSTSRSLRAREQQEVRHLGEEDVGAQHGRGRRVEAGADHEHVFEHAAEGEPDVKPEGGPLVAIDVPLLPVDLELEAASLHAEREAAAGLARETGGVVERRLVVGGEGDAGVGHALGPRPIAEDVGR